MNHFHQDEEDEEKEDSVVAEIKDLMMDPEAKKKNE